MRITVWENSPTGCLLVPLNIRCSRKCARPDLPGVSSAEPTLYQIIWVTTGVRRSGITTTCRPFLSVKEAGRSDVTVVWARAPPPERVAVEISAAKSETARRRLDIMTFVVRASPRRLTGLRKQFAKCERYGPNRRVQGNRANVHGASVGI